VLATPSPTLPRKRERERTEIAATSGESFAFLPFIPAHSASKTRVNALVLGIQGPQYVTLGPRWSSPPAQAGAGTNGANYFGGIKVTDGIFLTTSRLRLLTTKSIYARWIRSLAH
jgi:hypothetical protein